MVHSIWHRGYGEVNCKKSNCPFYCFKCLKSIFLCNYPVFSPSVLFPPFLSLPDIYMPPIVRIRPKNVYQPPGSPAKITPEITPTAVVELAEKLVATAVFIFPKT